MQSSFTQNNADLGGGIQNQNGTLSISDSTFSQNSATDGGGILNLGTLELVSSTINSNSATDYGGGIFDNGGTFVVRSTLSQNKADKDGGGFYAYGGQANIYNTSIIQNVADANNDQVGGLGGGVFIAFSVTFNVRNTLVAKNVGSSAATSQCSGVVNIYGTNVFSSFPFGANGCIPVGSPASGIFLNDPNLIGPLKDNGGPTWTHALLPGSNAINAGDPVQGCIGPNLLLLSTDQRGFPRVYGGRCDVGAYEYSVRYVYLPAIRR
jgi:hypothetical protein